MENVASVFGVVRSGEAEVAWFVSAPLVWGESQRVKFADGAEALLYQRDPAAFVRRLESEAEAEGWAYAQGRQNRCLFPPPLRSEVVKSLAFPLGSRIVGPLDSSILLAHPSARMPVLHRSKLLILSGTIEAAFLLLLRAEAAKRSLVGVYLEDPSMSEVWRLRKGLAAMTAMCATLEPMARKLLRGIESLVGVAEPTR